MQTLIGVQYRADDFLSGTRQGPGTTLTSSSAFRSPTSGSSTSHIQSRRRASVSGHPSFDRSTSDYLKALPRGNDDGIKSTYQLNVSVNGDIETPKKRTTVPGEDFEVGVKRACWHVFRTFLLPTVFDNRMRYTVGLWFVVLSRGRSRVSRIM